MCGIAGVQGGREESLVRAMTEKLRHRGPDDEGFHICGDVVLGMRRLAVQDPTGGRQPAYDESGRIAVVYNGEIYNFQELRRGLEERGHRLKSRADTEVLAHLYEEEGVGLLKRLNGMFSFALWDDARRRLILAVDPLGIKPLYYAAQGGKLAFASELKALLAVPFVSREVSPEGLGFYLSRGSIPAPHSVFKSMRKLLPGHWLSSDAGGLRIERYWSPPAPEEGAGGSVDEVERLLKEAVRRQMVSDVPLGLFLSGGLDSSALAAFAAEASPSPLKTFSIGFGPPDQEYDERSKAERVARIFGCDHTSLLATPDVRALVPELARTFDEPFADSSAVPTYLISREARRRVTVALTGVGGDEVFGGYPRYLGLRAAEHLKRLPSWMKRSVARCAAGLGDRGGAVNWRGRARRFLTGLDRPLDRQYALWTSLLSPDMLRDVSASDSLRPLEPLPGETTASAVAQRDLTEYLPSDLLCLADRAGMAHSLELRVPFLDLPLVEFMARIPLARKLAGFRLKAPLKDIMRRRLPEDLLRQTKKGFSIPLARWLREELKDLLDDFLSDDRLRARGYFRPDTVRRWRQEHAAGRENRADALWGLLTLEAWHQEWVDR